VVATLLHDVGDGAASARVEHDLVLVDKRILEHAAKDVSSRNVVTDLKPNENTSVASLGTDTHLQVSRGEVPGEGPVESIGIDTAGYVDGLGDLLDSL
jgi:hypothetical protein